MIFINFKSSLRGTGENALILARELAKAQKETKVPIILVPHDLDINSVRAVWEGEIWCQHADYGRGTGRNQVELLKEWPGPGEASKLSGTFLNHSENKFAGYNILARVVLECKEYGLKTLVFASSLAEIEKIIELKMEPTYIAYEPPELIGSDTTSVAKAKPDIIGKAAALAKKVNIPLIVGAGVKDKDDVKKSIELGAVGVAVSSAVILAEDPKKIVLGLAKGFGK